MFNENLNFFIFIDVKNNFFKIKRYYFNIFLNKNTLKNND